MALMVACATAMWLLAEWRPQWLLPWPMLRPAGVLLAVLGASVAASGVLAFRRARTTVNPLRPHSASALVESGIYARTRNPMYLGIAFALSGWAAWLSHPLALVPLAASLAYLDRVQIPAEERALQELFGERFEQYQRETPRWW